MGPATLFKPAGPPALAVLGPDRDAGDGIDEAYLARDARGRVVRLAILDDPELGCTARGYLGLWCDCPEFRGDRPCDHLRVAVAQRLLAPAPGWERWADADDQHARYRTAAAPALFPGDGDDAPAPRTGYCAGERGPR